MRVAGLLWPYLANAVQRMKKISKLVKMMKMVENPNIYMYMYHDLEY